ncbi:MAG: glycosyltransferase [Nitrospira sp.]|nr:glycosyltransferase [Nitrospira sp.]
MDRKKVLHIIEHFNIAGAEIIVKDLLLNLPSSEWQLEVCVLNDIGILGKELRDSGHTVHSLNWKGDNLTDLQVARKLKNTIDKRKIDLVHAHNVTPWYFTILATLSKRIKRCVTLHGFIRGEGSTKKKILYLLLSQFTSKIVIVSKDIENQLKEIPFLNMNNVEVILNGIDIKTPGDGFNKIEKRKSLGLAENDFVIGTVGRTYPEKNIEMQIKLIHSLKLTIPNIKLVVVGEKYAHMKNLEALVEQLNLLDRVFFLGLRRDVPELLKIFDIFVMTSLSEGTSLSLLEAMASGLPVVVSNVGGNSSIVSHDKNGLLFDVDDLEALSSHIQNLYRDSNKRYSLAKKAEETGASYTIKNMVNNYQNVYNNILNGKNLPV